MSALPFPTLQITNKWRERGGSRTILNHINRAFGSFTQDVVQIKTQMASSWIFSQCCVQLPWSGGRRNGDREFRDARRLSQSTLAKNSNHGRAKRCKLDWTFDLNDETGLILHKAGKCSLCDDCSAHFDDHHAFTIKRWARIAILPLSRNPRSHGLGLVSNAAFRNPSYRVGKGKGGQGRARARAGKGEGGQGRARARVGKGKGGQGRARARAGKGGQGRGRARAGKGEGGQGQGRARAGKGKGGQGRARARAGKGGQGRGRARVDKGEGRRGRTRARAGKGEGESSRRGGEKMGVRGWGVGKECEGGREEVSEAVRRWGWWCTVGEREREGETGPGGPEGGQRKEGRGSLWKNNSRVWPWTSEIMANATLKVTQSGPPGIDF
ncbi:hypothetical protein EDB85DRAFT_1891764 [Lactarius pseudohatsudake]|nr:hypothetical protein EDB85DRAFT_1891764 [Lactarius pseudohatsudake]